MSGLPPVIDPSRARVSEVMSRSPFNIFNIIAIVLIVVIGFYLYKRFIVKKPQRRFPLVQPVIIKTAAAPAPAPSAVIEEEEEEEVPDVTEEQEDEEAEE